MDTLRCRCNFVPLLRDDAKVRRLILLFEIHRWYLEHFDLRSGQLKLPRVWRSMFLMQPPITACKVDVSQYGYCTVYDKNGVTLGA